MASEKRFPRPKRRAHIVPIPVHIYPLSRLVHASAASWEAELRKIEEGKLHAYRYYLPLREAVVSYCKSKGKKRDSIMLDMQSSAAAISASRGANPVKDNLSAFDIFEEHFYPRVSLFGQSLLRDESKSGCAFEGLILSGLPHFTVVDEGGTTRYVYLHASKWDDDDLKAYLELLSIIIENRFGGSADTLWCMDLRTGKDVKWKSSSRIRARCMNASRLYVRLIEAMQSPR
jgi:hypothetical protein